MGTRLVCTVAAILATLSGVAHAGPSNQGGHKGKGKKPQPDWVSRPYVRPVAGVSVWGGSGGETHTVAAAGVEAGIVYREVHKPLPRWRVTPRVRGVMYSAGEGFAGLHLRGGVQAGPRWKYFGISSGPDLYRDQLITSGLTLDPVFGMAWPMLGLVRLGPVSAQAGVEPSWFLSGDRQSVNWSKTSTFGFGDEFAYLAGVGMRVQKMVVGVNWRKQITAMGEGTNWSVNAGFRL
jgi:hypothetical protein